MDLDRYISSRHWRLPDLSITPREAKVGAGLSGLVVAGALIPVLMFGGGDASESHASPGRAAPLPAQGVQPGKAPGPVGTGGSGLVAAPLPPDAAQPTTVPAPVRVRPTGAPAAPGAPAPKVAQSGTTGSSTTTPPTTSTTEPGVGATATVPIVGTVTATVPPVLPGKPDPTKTKGGGPGADSPACEKDNGKKPKKCPEPTEVPLSGVGLQ